MLKKIKRIIDNLLAVACMMYLVWITTLGLIEDIEINNNHLMVAILATLIYLKVEINESVYKNN